MLFLRMPRYISNKTLRLRPLRMSDSPFILSGLNGVDIVKAKSLSIPIALSWLSMWWQMKKTFCPAYCIEHDSKQIGFIGLYNLISGQSAEVSLIIFDISNRRRGYGTMAFRLLTQALMRACLIKNLSVTVKEDNHASTSLWKKLGFKTMRSHNGLTEMIFPLERF